MIRLATNADVPRLVEMGRRFISSTNYQSLLPVNPTQMSDFARRLIEARGVLVCERDGAVVGMIGLAFFPHFISGEMVAAEVFWWLEPEYRGGTEGIRLLRAAESQARARGAVKLQMIAPSDEVSAMYQRMGYAFVEAAYQRSL
jgi:GNAT superfamily N-acetyltransferase